MIKINEYKEKKEYYGNFEIQYLLNKNPTNIVEAKDLLLEIKKKETLLKRKIKKTGRNW